MRKRLTLTQEFEIMKLVLDKFLWLGFGIMALGVYKMIETADVANGIYYLTIGVAVLLLFLVLIVKEYEIIR